MYDKLLRLFFGPLGLAFFLIVTGCTGCISAKSCAQLYPQYIVPTQSGPFNYDAFTQVRVEITMRPTDCFDTISRESCKDFSDTLPDAVVNSHGSGAVIAHENGKTYVLTAAHVCWVEPYETVGRGPFLMEIQQISSINLLTYAGETVSAKVFYVDEERDVCLMTAQGTWGSPLPIADGDPIEGRKYYNMAAPYSIYSPGMVLSFDGYFSGNDSEWYFYTIPARPGSSGSPIINSHGEVVGIITMASTVFETLAIVTTPDSIRDAHRAIEMDSETSDDTDNNRVLFRTVPPTAD